MKRVACARCAWRGEVSTFVKRCPECAGLTEFEYDRTGARLYESDNPMERYFDLLPLVDRAHIHWLGDGNTPTVHAKELGKTLKMDQVWLKVEGANPSRSTKDRAFSVVYSHMAQCGIREFGVCSTGNSSTACARGAQCFPDEFTAHVFVGRDFLNRLNVPDSPNVKVYVVDGDFVDAGAAAQEYCERNAILWEGGFFNPARRCGHKLAYLEALDAIGPRGVAWVFQPVSSGMGMIGARQGFLDYLGMERIERMPRFVGVQQERCSPMVRAWEAGAMSVPRDYVLEGPSGIAKALLRGNPTATYPFFRQMIEATNGQLCAVTDYEIIEARWLASTCEGLEICNASAAGLAGLIKLRRRGVLKPNEPVLAVLTGRDRPDSVTPKDHTRVARAQRARPAAQAAENRTP